MGQNEIIDSDTYRKTKKKTARNLQISFCIMVMSCSENKGKTIDLPALKAELSKIQGIDSKRLEEIMVVLEKFLNVE